MANYVLEILDGDRAGEVLPVSDRTLRIGRKPSNDVVLNDEKASGVHAEVVLEGDRHVLRDLGSTNGTFLDGKRVTEIVLTPGDVVTIGRVRVKFRGEGEEAAAGDLAVHRLDTRRLQRRGGSLGVIAALVAVAAGAGGYFWWQAQRSGGDATAASPQQRQALAVAGNKLTAATAACEGETGWNLRTGGVGFQPTAQRHTGSGALLAQRAEGDSADFALAGLQQDLPVFGGRTVLLAAHVRTSGNGKVAVRAVCSAKDDAMPFHFRCGTTPLASEAWQRVEVAVPVPPGCDRLQIELLALLGDGEASGYVDDVALTDAPGGAGAAAPLDLRLSESGQTALGNQAALAVRSTDGEDPATLLAVVPDQVPAELAALQALDLCALSDVGATLACTAAEHAFTVTATGADTLQLVFPADAADRLLAAGADGAFASTPGDGTFTAQSILLGDRATRLLVRLAAPVACRGRSGGNLYRLAIASGKFELELGFRSERLQAEDLLRRARTAANDRRPGEALDRLDELLAKVPHDSQTLADAQTLRTQLLADQADALRGLGQDLGEARFFETRGGYARIALGLDDLVERYGERHLADADAVKALRQQVQAAIAAIDRAAHDAERARLLDLAKSFTEAGKTSLAKAVDDYVVRVLPADAGGGNGDGGGAGPGEGKGKE